MDQTSETTQEEARRETDGMSHESKGSRVVFDQVNKRYGRRTALENVSFELPAGQVIGLVGPNGSGKTTSLRLMAGLIQPDGGTVSVDGEPVRGRLACHHVAYMAEDEALYDVFSVNEMLQFYAGIYDDFDLERAYEMRDFMDLPRDQRIGALSRGNRGRLKLILVLSRQAPLILIDEPLAGLDVIVRDTVKDGLIAYMNLEQQTVIVTTHELAEIERLLDTVVVIHQGRIRAVEPVDEIRSQHGKSLVQWFKDLITGDRDQASG